MCVSQINPPKLGNNSTRAPIKLWTDKNEVEAQAVEQLKNIASLPWVYKHVAVMPDVHYGKGATVGSVIAMKDAVAPAAVGVDIGCGMMAVRTNLTSHDLPDSLQLLRHRVEKEIPVGFNSHDHVVNHVKKSQNHLWSTFRDLDEHVQKLQGRAKKQMGSLGGGNHFIELCISTTDEIWLMLHSGSRNIGKTLADIHINRAKKLAHNRDLPDPDLAVFLAGTPQMEAYRHDLMWAQEYAWQNREVMMDLYQAILKKLIPKVEFLERVACHHNYVSEETHFDEDVLVTRKGAISARSGELGIIPGAMGAKSFIVRGLGNAESFHSASHGAGRRMSRGKARRTYTADDLALSTEGVECRKDKKVVDEIVHAYKDIQKVIDYQSDLIEVLHEIKGIMVVKG